MEAGIEMRCFCGHDCSRCVTYIATINDDNILKEQSQRFYKETFEQDIPLEQFNCLSGKSDKVFVLCDECPFRKCCNEQNIEVCDMCPEYPCKMLGDYQTKYVNKYNQI